jgi:hypothetical protein
LLKDEPLVLRVHYNHLSIQDSLKYTPRFPLVLIITKYFKYN